MKLCLTRYAPRIGASSRISSSIMSSSGGIVLGPQVPQNFLPCLVGSLSAEAVRVVNFLLLSFDRLLWSATFLHSKPINICNLRPRVLLGAVSRIGPMSSSTYYLIDDSGNCDRQKVCTSYYLPILRVFLR